MGVSIRQQGKWVNEIFKQYKVIDDVAEIIQKKVHNDQMKIICWVIKKMFHNEWSDGFSEKLTNENYQEFSMRGKEFVYNDKNKHFVEKAFFGDITKKYLIMNILLYQHHEKKLTCGRIIKYCGHRYCDLCIYHPSFIEGIYTWRFHALQSLNKFWKTIHHFRINKFYGRKIYTNSEMKKILDENDWIYNSKAKKIDLVNIFWGRGDNEW